MSRPKNMSERIQQETRLIMLRELAGQLNGRLTSTSMLGELLDVWGIDRDRDWVENEFNWLEQMGAITVVSAGTVKIACITLRGKQHLRHNIQILGIQWPTDPLDIR